MTQKKPPLIQRPLLSFSLTGAPLKHPDEEIAQLVEALIPYGERLEYPYGHRLSMQYQGEKVIYILNKGCLSFRHHDTATIISYLYPPLVTGLGEVFTHCSIGFHRAETPIEVYRVSQSKFYSCLGNNAELWKATTVILAYTVFRSIAQNALVSTKSAYDVVRNLLIDLNQQPDEIKSIVSASRYILDRAPLARSTVMHLLSELQRGGYIVTAKGGYLRSIDKLPEKF